MDNSTKLINDVISSITEVRDELFSKKATDLYIDIIREVLEGLRDELANEIRKDVRKEFEDELFEQRKKRKIDLEWSNDKIRSHIVGMKYEEAEDFIEKECPNYCLRKFWEDGNLLVNNANKKFGRLNVPVEKGIIVEKATYYNNGQRMGPRGSYFG